MVVAIFRAGVTGTVSVVAELVCGRRVSVVFVAFVSRLSVCVDFGCSASAPLVDVGLIPEGFRATVLLFKPLGPREAGDVVGEKVFI